MSNENNKFRCGKNTPLTRGSRDNACKDDFDGEVPFNDEVTILENNCVNYGNKREINDSFTTSHEKIRNLVLEQLDYYSKTGKRLRSFMEIVKTLSMREDDVRNIAKKFLRSLFESDAKAVYDMIFGKVYTSLHRIRHESAIAGFILKTTTTEWFQLVKNRKDLITNRKGKKLARLKVRVECIKDGHVTYKEIRRLLWGSDQSGCAICAQISNAKYLVDQTIKYENIINALEDTPFELVSSEKEFVDAVNEARSKGKGNTAALLRWKHKKCGHVFERSYINFFMTFTCPKCIQKKNQKITHAYCEYLFGKPFKVEEKINKIFDVNKNPEIKDLHGNVEIDIFQDLDLRDKNGNLIHLGIEYNGKQHDDSNEGWRAYKGINKYPDIDSGSEKYDQLWFQWRRLIKRDKIKMDVFKKNEKNGYYLIVVDYTVRQSQKLQFIINEFETLTGIKLEDVPEIDWRCLL